MFVISARRKNGEQKKSWRFALKPSFSLRMLCCRCDVKIRGVQLSLCYLVWSLLFLPNTCSAYLTAERLTKFFCQRCQETVCFSRNIEKNYRCVAKSAEQAAQTRATWIFTEQCCKPQEALVPRFLSFVLFKRFPAAAEESLEPFVFARFGSGCGWVPCFPWVRMYVVTVATTNLVLFVLSVGVVRGYSWPRLPLSTHSSSSINVSIISNPEIESLSVSSMLALISVFCFFLCLMMCSLIGAVSPGVWVKFCIASGSFGVIWSTSGFIVAMFCGLSPPNVLTRVEGYWMFSGCDAKLCKVLSVVSFVVEYRVKYFSVGTLQTRNTEELFVPAKKEKKRLISVRCWGLVNSGCRERDSSSHNYIYFFVWCETQEFTQWRRDI